MKKLNKVKMEQLLAKGALLADMRSPVSFRDSHISGAVNLPLRNFTNKIMGMPRTTTLIMYSQTLTDPELLQAKNYAEQLGFKTIYLSDYSSLNQ